MPKIIALKNRWVFAALSLVVVAIPAIVTLLMIRFHLDTDISQGIPSYYGTYNDAFYYWRQIDTFAHAGFQGGYYTLNETPARAGFSHFYTHGPMFPLIYGLLSRITGWEHYSGPVINLILITVASALFVYATRPSTWQLIALGVVVATCWYILLYLPSTMQETLHTTFAIGMGILFCALLQRDEPLSMRMTILVILLIGVMALVRVLWSFMYLPFFVLNTRKPSPLRLGVAIVAAGALIALFLGITTVIMSPYAFNHTDELAHDFSVSLQQGLTTLRNYIQLNIDNFDIGYRLAILERYQVLILAVVSFIATILMIGARWIKRVSAVSSRLHGREIIAHLLILTPILLFQFLIYDFFEWHDFRTLAPPFLVSMLLLVAFKRYLAIGLIVVSNLLVLPAFMTTYAEFWSQQFGYDKAKIVSYQEMVRDLIVYDENTSNAWCNTVLIRMQDRDGKAAVFPPELLDIDPRIGISFFFAPQDVSLPMKSKYLLIDVPTIDSFAYTRTNILGYTPIGNLYLNLEADCWQD